MALLRQAFAGMRISSSRMAELTFEDSSFSGLYLDTCLSPLTCCTAS